MRILFVTDSFPPSCGGSGWSTYELARGLRARGHIVRVVQPVAGRESAAGQHDGFEVRRFPARAPSLPYLRNYAKSERLHARLAPFLRRVAGDEGIEVVHGQHVMSAPAAVTAARSLGIPAVVTVRDYWPVCYWSDLILDPDDSRLCPQCSVAGMTRCIRPRAGRAWPLALPLIPYMRRNLAFKRRLLSQADAVVAVSSAIERDLHERAPELNALRVERIPNSVDCDRLLQEAAAQPPPFDGRYAIYAGKLAVNKGVSHLVAAAARARLPWPLLVVGDGPERETVEEEAASSGLDVRFTGWLPRAQVLGWMAHASLVIFPSHGPESLSRVLIEASVLGRPIAAMDTGGTSDIVRHEETGLLSSGPEGLAASVARLVENPEEARRLGENAARHARETFDASRVAATTEKLYEELLRKVRERQGGR